jgi:hypothetical protein
VFVTVCSYPIPAVRFVGIFVGIGRTNVHGDFRYSDRREFSRWPARTMARAIPVGAIVETGTARACLLTGEPTILFVPVNTARHLVGIPVGVGSNQR